MATSQSHKTGSVSNSDIVRAAEEARIIRSPPKPSLFLPKVSISPLLQCPVFPHILSQFTKHHIFRVALVIFGLLFPEDVPRVRMLLSLISPYPIFQSCTVSKTYLQLTFYIHDCLSISYTWLLHFLLMTTCYP